MIHFVAVAGTLAAIDRLAPHLSSALQRTRCLAGHVAAR